MMPVDLADAIREFIAGRDRSLELANRIEVGLDDLYGDTEPYADAVGLLARYRPEGGPYLASPEDVVRALTAVLVAASFGAQDSR